MPEGHDTIIEVSNIMSFVLYTQILKQSVLKPASPGITLKMILCHFVSEHCKDCKNFNSMFAITSGLRHSCVDRLRNTWEKLPNKYAKMFNVSHGKHQ